MWLWIQCRLLPLLSLPIPSFLISSFPFTPDLQRRKNRSRKLFSFLLTLPFSFPWILHSTFPHPQHLFVATCNLHWFLLLFFLSYHFSFLNGCRHDHRVFVILPPFYLYLQGMKRIRKKWHFRLNLNSSGLHLCTHKNFFSTWVPRQELSAREKARLASYAKKIYRSSGVSLRSATTAVAMIDAMWHEVTGKIPAKGAKGGVVRERRQQSNCFFVWEEEMGMGKMGEQLCWLAFSCLFFSPVDDIRDSFPRPSGEKCWERFLNQRVPETPGRALARRWHSLHLFPFHFSISVWPSFSSKLHP